MPKIIPLSPLILSSGIFGHKRFFRRFQGAFHGAARTPSAGAGRGIDEAHRVVHTDGMDDQRRTQLQQRRTELLDNPTGLDAAETRRLDAEDRVTMCTRAKNTPGFPVPFPAEVQSAERDLAEATEECNRIHAELKSIDEELGAL